LIGGSSAGKRVQIAGFVPACVAAAAAAINKLCRVCVGGSLKN